MAPETHVRTTSTLAFQAPPVRFEPKQCPDVDAPDLNPANGSGSRWVGVRVLQWPRGWRNLTPGATIGRAALAGATALLCAVAVFHRPPTVLAPAPVTLTAFRGGDPTQGATAPAGRPLALEIEAVDVPAATRCRVDIVNATGRLVWSGVATAAEGQLNLGVPDPLGAGIYWVRLYAGGPEPIREFGLRLK